MLEPLLTLTTHKRAGWCTCRNIECSHSGLLSSIVAHWLNSTASARLIFGWEAHVNVFELFKGITSEMFPSTWLSAEEKKKSWNTEESYNNNQNMLYLFLWPCLSYNSFFILLPYFCICFKIYPWNHLHPPVMLFVVNVSYHKTWITWCTWTRYQTHMTNISVWQLRDKRGLTVPSCSVVQSLVSLGMHYYFLSSFSIDRRGWTHLTVVLKIICLSPAPSSSSLLSLS